MKLVIPAVTDVIELASDFTFTLECAWDNRMLLKMIDPALVDWQNNPKSITHTLPQGSKLKVVEYLIRTEYHRVREIGCDLVKFKLLTGNSNKDPGFYVTLEQLGDLEMVSVTPAVKKVFVWTSPRLRKCTRQPDGYSHLDAHQMFKKHKWITANIVQTLQQLADELNHRRRSNYTWVYALNDVVRFGPCSSKTNKSAGTCTVTFKGSVPKYSINHLNTQVLNYGYNEDVIITFELNKDRTQINNLTATWIPT